MNDYAEYVKRVIKRVWAKVDVRRPDECWPWTAGHFSDGYGMVGYLGHTMLAHRAIWTITHGAPGKLFVCHTCDNHSCCNPSHLYLGTHTDNMRDMMAKGRQAKHEASGQAKLTEKQVAEIRHIYAGGNMTHREIGQLYGMSYSEIGRITRRECWRDV